ncbi:MAG: hypothetical protein QM734_00950 [Cyclobacteriaceae bacterium]
MRKLLAIIFPVFIVMHIQAQKKDSLQNGKHFQFSSVFIGYNVKQQHYFEVGYLKVKEKGFGHHPFGVVKSASCEFKFNSTVLGPKISVWAYGGSSIAVVGVNLIDYFDLIGNNSLVFRPEIGLGLYGIKATYGWNLTLTAKTSIPINENQFSVQVPLKIKTK